MDFRDSIVWVTGASSGIGEALAYELAGRGARLILSARREERLEEVKAACARPQAHVVLPLDLERPETLAAAARQALERLGRVDVLVNNGGVSQRSLAMETDMAVVRRLFEINFFGTVALTKAVLPAMLARRAGRVVVVSSLVGKFATPQRSTYAATKHALHGYFDALRAEVEPEGVGVTIVCPGFIRTDVSVNALAGDGSKRGVMDRSIANGLPADVFARRMADAVAREKDEVYIGGKEKAGVYVKRFAPWLFNRVIGRVRVT